GRDFPRCDSPSRFEIDTRHFTGNYPPAASLETCISDAEVPGDEADWVEVVPVTALKGDDRLGLALPAPVRATHVRLHIYPDGGIARLRVWGRILFDPAMAGTDGRLDLAAMAHGGRVVAANDAHFGAPDNLIAPGRGVDMGDGWETRRRREPGHDWAILALACPGRIDEVILDTAHFKGNYPDRFSLQAAMIDAAPDALLVTQSQFWPTLLEPMSLGPDAEHRITEGLADLGPVSHVRLNIFPDGGVSRLRLLGRPYS
ncbi:MAG: allantoicase, partial [Alphaproteobacteria bacterium]